MSASVVNRENVDLTVRLAPEGPGGKRVMRSGALNVERRGHGRTDRMTIDTDQVPVETEVASDEGGGGEPAPTIVSRRWEFELDMMTAPGFMSEWAFESEEG
jgi:hypothetical protein